MNLNLFFSEVKEDISSHLTEIKQLRNLRSMKSDESYVTDGDLLVNSIINKAIRKNFDNFQVISEEDYSEDSREDANYIIVVDPIDGTENFTSGLIEWGVSISCFHNKRHIGSLIGCPELSLWINSGDSIERFHSRIRGLSSSLSKEDLVQATAGFEYRVIGCCVYNLINVIRGSFVSFENTKGAKSWDILGGLNIALEQNLKVIVNDEEYSGQYLHADRKYRFKIEQR